MKTLTQERALEIAQTINAELRMFATTVDKLVPLILQAYNFEHGITESLDSNLNIRITYSQHAGSFKVVVSDERGHRHHLNQVPFVLKDSNDSISVTKLILENGPFKTLKLKKMGEFFRALEKAKTPSEAYDLGLAFIGDETEVSASFRYGDFKISYELSVIGEVTRFDLKVEDRNTRDVMLDLSLRLNRSNIKNIYTSVSKMMEMFK